MKKKLVVTFIIVLTVIVGVIAVSSLDYIKTRQYSGDRITGSFIMTVDGKEYDPMDASLEYEKGGTQRLGPLSSSFSIKGGEYGSYEIGFWLDNDVLYELTGDELFKSYETDPRLIFRYINTNWWNITKMTLSAEMVSSDGEWIINTKVIYSEKDEYSDNYNEYDPIEKTFLYSDVMSGNGIIQFGL